MTSNDEIYLSYLCDQILVAYNRIHKKLDRYDEFLSSNTTPMISYHEQPSWHVAADVVQPRPPPDPPNGQLWNYVQPDPDQQVPTYGLVLAYDPELYRHQFNPPAAPQPPNNYTNSYALLRSPYAGPPNLLLPPYKPDRDQLHHDHQLIASQQPPLTAAASANLPHQNYQPISQQRYTGYPMLGWPQPPPQHSPSCWCPPTATPLPTAAVPISTPANGFVEIEHLSRPPQHAQFQIFAKPISDSSDIDMSIMEEVRTEELPPIEVIDEKDGTIEDGFDYSTEKILDSSTGFCGFEKAEKETKPIQDHKREEEQVQGQFE